MNPCITCPHCRGEGKVPIGEEWAAMLAVLRAADRELTGAELGRLAGIANTTACNRLADMERRGLVTSYRLGRKRFWRATTQETPDARS